MWLKIKKLFLNEVFILFIILINSAIIFAQSYHLEYRWLTGLDVLCTFLFAIEMVVKHCEYGVRKYWSDGWNRMDGILVILSIPSILALVFPHFMNNLSFLLILRLLRILRFFRIMHFFPNFGKILKGFSLALRETAGVFLSFFVVIVVLGMFNCSLFAKADPEHFCTPIRAIYSVFQICTVEGWYDIPNALVDYYGSSTLTASLVRFYFCMQLIVGGIIGMSFINSVFVDAMVSDNNEGIEEKLEELDKKLTAITQELERMRKQE